MQHHHLIARTKTQDTAWLLIGRLKAACPNNGFVLVLESADGPPQVYPVGPFHPIDQTKAKQVVRQFREEMCGE